MKMGDLRRMLRQKGWKSGPGKGSHEKWYDPRDNSRSIILSHSNDEEVPKYILCRIRKLFSQ